MPKVKNSLETTRLLKEEEVSRLAIMGYSTPRIAIELNLSQSYVSVIRQHMRDKNRLATVVIRDGIELREEKLQQLTEIRTQAFSAWLESRKCKETKTVDKEPLLECPVCSGVGSGEKGTRCLLCQGKGFTGGIKGMKLQRVGQAGDPRFLSVILDTLKAERELLGIDGEASEGNKTVSKFFEMLMGVVGGDTRDSVEDRILREVSGDVSPSHTTNGEHVPFPVPGTHESGSAHDPTTNGGLNENPPPSTPDGSLYESLSGAPAGGSNESDIEVLQYDDEADIEHTKEIEEEDRESSRHHKNGDGK